MTTPQNPASPAEPTAAAPQGSMQIGLGAQYIKDFSFESPLAPQIFNPTQSTPDIHMGVNVHSRGIGENSYEVLLALKMEAKLDGKTAFIAELSYGGMFVIPSMTEEQMKLLLLVEAPRLLFPFARAILSNTVREGGFPQIMIAPIDFMTLYVANKGSIGTMPTAGAA